MYSTNLQQFKTWAIIALFSDDDLAEQFALMGIATSHPIDYGHVHWHKIIIHSCEYCRGTASGSHGSPSWGAAEAGG
ncbi:MAG: hypothetical protein LKF74_00645 [Megasphaera sp.]|jgi:hypothetical protein|nr:hypothetical protein [Megasphaera sp.]MCH4217052.1 hypothetical protein [Megasphaera sp.]